MLNFLAGVVVAGSGTAGLWYCWPRNGRVHPFIVKPVLDWLIPTGIISALALGTAMILSGVLT